MVVADLHAHTTNSDGTLAIDELPEVARRAGLDAVAVTDHDQPHPGLDQPIADHDGVTVIHGIELRVETGDQRVDLLGYGLDPTPELRAECDRIQRDRAERGGQIVDRVEDRLDVELAVEPRPGLGRPHIARAIAAHPSLDFDVQRAFDELIGDGQPCYVSREIPSFEDGRTLLSEACRIVGLAHPLRYEDPSRALALTADLDAVELWYPYDRPVDPGERPDTELVENAIARNSVVPTGGSDAHGTTLGAAGLDEEAWDRVRPKLRR